MQQTIFSLILLLAGASFAAPHPATSTSILTNPEKGLFFAMRGFQLGTMNSDWILNSSDSENQVRYSHKNSDTASMLVKVDDLQTDSDLETYAKKWVRDYSSYGFELLGTRTFSENSRRGMVVDLINHAKEKQIRQAIFVKKSTAVILTCTDDIKEFNSVLPNCNQLIRNFSWMN